MLTLNNFRTLLLSSLISTALFACSGDDNAQNQTAPAKPATISKSNAGDYSAALAKTTTKLDTNPNGTGTTDAVTTVPSVAGDAISGIASEIGTKIAADAASGTVPSSITVDLASILNNALPACTAEGASNLTSSLNVDNISVSNGISYNVSGSIDFNNFCMANNGTVSEIYLNGSILISGNQDNIDIKFDSFTIAANGQIASPGCSFSFTSDGGVTTDCNDIANSTLRIEDLAANIDVDGIHLASDANGNITVSIDGSVETADGFVNVSTPTPLALCDNGAFSAGEVIISGSDNTQASINFSDANCTFKAQWCFAEPDSGLDPVCTPFDYGAAPAATPGL